MPGNVNIINCLRVFFKTDVKITISTYVNIIHNRYLYWRVFDILVINLDLNVRYYMFFGEKDMHVNLDGLTSSLRELFPWE